MAIIRNRYFLWTLSLVVAFLLGLLPQYARTRALQSELNATALGNRRMQLRDLAAFALVKAAQKNYGLAAQTTTEFFDEVQRMAAEAPAEEQKKMFDEISSQRDNVTAKLAKGDATVLNDLENIYLKTRSATTP